MKPNSESSAEPRPGARELRGESEASYAYCANAVEEPALPGYGDVPGACACGHAGCHDDAPAAEPNSQIGLGPTDT